MDNQLVNTGVICMISEAEGCYVDMGNYFMYRETKVLVTSNKLATKYGHLIKVPIYVLK